VGLVAHAQILDLVHAGKVFESRRTDVHPVLVPQLGYPLANEEPAPRLQRLLHQELSGYLWHDLRLVLLSFRIRPSMCWASRTSILRGN
jgi:hypothetical protein